MWHHRFTPETGDASVADPRAELPRAFRILRDQRELDEALQRAEAQDQALLEQLNRRAARYHARHLR
jgi:hypothetical protein